jgi:hypothetical protein
MSEQTTEAARVAALQAQAAADYARAEAQRAANEAAARNQLAHAITNGNTQGGTR